MGGCEEMSSETTKKVTDRMESIEGVEKAFWNPNDLSLTLFWNPTLTDIDTLKIRCQVSLDDVGLWGWAVEKIKFYTVD